MLWHYRLGHPNFVYFEKIFPKLFNNKNPNQFKCEICQLSKHTRHVFPSHAYKSSQPFTVIHSDVWGPARINNISGARWFVLFIDDHTRITWIFLMKEKTEVCQIFKNFNNMIQTQFHTRIRVLRTDNGKEFFNRSLGDYLLGEGIVHQSSCVDTPQQNGVSERKNRQLLVVARSLMFSMNVPKHFWGEAVLTATYLINRLPSRVLGFQTPLQIFAKTYPNSHLISHIPSRIFGCTVFVHIHAQHRSKLDPRFVRYVFLGYSQTQKGYKCYSPTIKQFFVSFDVTFMKTTPFYTKTEF